MPWSGISSATPSALIASHPDGRFRHLFSPYSILQWVAMRDACPPTLKIVYDLTTHIQRRLANFRCAAA